MLVQLANKITTTPIFIRLKETFPQSNVYVVGGFVRDSYLGLNPKDIDLVIEGIPYSDLVKFMELNEDTYSSIELNLYTLNMSILLPEFESEIDISIPRKDIHIEGSKSYRGFQCEPVGTIEEDLHRRDFTCNALAYNINTLDLVDPFNGLQDILNKELKMVSDVETFDLDPMRLLRLFKYTSVLGVKLSTSLIDYAQLPVDADIYRNKLISYAILKDTIEYAFSNKHSLESFRIAWNILYHKGVFAAIASQFEDKVPDFREKLKAVKSHEIEGITTLVQFVSNISRSRKLITLFLGDLGFSKLFISSIHSYLQKGQFEADVILHKQLNVGIRSVASTYAKEYFNLGFSHTDINIPEPVRHFMKCYEEDLPNYPIDRSKLDVKSSELIALGIDPRSLTSVYNSILDNIIIKKFNNNNEEIIKFVRDEYINS